jgi:peptide-methionine (S)-S-oxide reductase
MRTIDPLDAGGSFCDRGYQYRSAFFVAEPEQRRVAEAVKARTAQR